jgi:hypothetical protein
MMQDVYPAPTTTEVAAFVTANPDVMGEAHERLCTALAERFGLSRVAAHAQIASRPPADVWPHVEHHLLQIMVERGALTIN